MNRREAIAGTAALAVTTASAAKVHVEENEDKYWESQSQIDSLEQELSEMKAHARIMHRSSNG